MAHGESESTAAIRGVNGADAQDSAAARWRSAEFWWAVAGMAAAIALGCVFVTIEFAIALSQREDYMNRRIAALNATVRQLRREDTADQRKLGAAQQYESQDLMLARLLFASDLRTLKLATPNEPPAQHAESDRGPAGMLAMSESARSAMIEASGLKPAGEHKVYRIWWIPKHGAPVWAADFIVGQDGNAEVEIDLQHSPPRPRFIEITVENENYADSPSGPIVLHGHVPH